MLFFAIQVSRARRSCAFTASLKRDAIFERKSPEFSTLYKFDVENSMVRPIDDLAQNDYNIIEIIIIQIILSER